MPFDEDSRDSQSDYSSDSDFDETPIDSKSSLTGAGKGSLLAGKRDQPGELIGGRNRSQINELLSLCSENKGVFKDSNYELGGGNWRDLWVTSIGALGASYYKLQDKSQISSSDRSKFFEKKSNKRSVNSPPKTLLPLTSNHPPSSQPQPNLSSASSVAHSISATSDSVDPHQSNQSHQTMNLSTQEKQKYVLSILRRMESRLEHEDPILAHSFTENASKILSTADLAISSPFQGGPGQQTTSPKNVSSNIQYAFENKIKYGHVKGVLEKVISVMRKIRKEITKLKDKERKELIETQIQRGQVDLLGPTAFRERIHHDLSLLLTPQEVTLVMKKFDLNNTGLVNIADVYGNALLVSSPRKKPQPHRLLPLSALRSPSNDLKELSSSQIIPRKGTGHRLQRRLAKKLPPVSEPTSTATDTYTTTNTNTSSVSIQSENSTISAGNKESEKELYKRCVYRLAQLSDDAIYSCLSHTGFTTQLLDHLLPYLSLSISSSSTTTTTAANPSLPSHPPSPLVSGPPPSSPPLSINTSSHPPSQSQSQSQPPSSRFIISALEFEFLLKEFGLELTSQEKKLVTKRCHDNSRGKSFNEINIVKLFHDRMKMKKLFLKSV